MPRLGDESGAGSGDVAGTGCGGTWDSSSGAVVGAGVIGVEATAAAGGPCTTGTAAGSGPRKLGAVPMTSGAAAMPAGAETMRARIGAGGVAAR
mmetsp:Transcript_61473/g.193812  ORF Transcript_61473/g.193812 Transcript_61473/m.193812 type:complete len:94 (+) Transcript_61473:751-1032(+)